MCMCVSYCIYAYIQGQLYTHMHTHTFTYSSLDGHLGCCNECMGAYAFSIWVSSDKYLEMKLLGPSVFLVIAFVLKSVLSGVSTAAPNFFVLFLFS